MCVCRCTYTKLQDMLPASPACDFWGPSAWRPGAWMGPSQAMSTRHGLVPAMDGLPKVLRKR